MSQQVTTPIFRISYPNLFQARKNDLNGKMEFGCVAVFDKAADLTGMRTAATAACEEKWGADKAKWPAKVKERFKSVFRKNEDKWKEDSNGNKVEADGYPAGGVFVNLKTEKQPGVVDAQVKPILEPRDLYAGCYCLAACNVGVYDQGGNPGFSFYLNHIQKVRDGEPLGGATRPEDSFKPFKSEAKAGASSGGDDLWGNE